MVFFVGILSVIVVVLFCLTVSHVFEIQRLRGDVGVMSCEKANRSDVEALNNFNANHVNYISSVDKRVTSFERDMLTKDSIPDYPAQFRKIADEAKKSILEYQDKSRINIKESLEQYTKAIDERCDNLAKFVDMHGVDLVNIQGKFVLRNEYELETTGRLDGHCRTLEANAVSIAGLENLYKDLNSRLLEDKKDLLKTDNKFTIAVGTNTDEIYRISRELGKMQVAKVSNPIVKGKRSK